MLKVPIKVRRVDESARVANEEGADISYAEEPEWVEEARELV
jgi:hypothetical protein